MNSLLYFVSSLTLILIVLPLGQQFVSAAGGIAEMKALTGDAPYLGPGNQEQAPEYFGEAAYRQYYNNPAYGGGGYSGDFSGVGYRSRYGYNAAMSGLNGMYNSNSYHLPYRSYQARYNPRFNLPYQQGYMTDGLGGSGIVVPSRSGYYSGSGNDWA